MALGQKLTARRRKKWGQEDVKKSTEGQSAHFSGDQKCIPHPRELPSGPLIAKDFSLACSALANNRFFHIFQSPFFRHASTSGLFVPGA